MHINGKRTPEGLPYKTQCIGHPTGTPRWKIVTTTFSHQAHLTSQHQLSREHQPPHQMNNKMRTAAQMKKESHTIKMDGDTRLPEGATVALHNTQRDGAQAQNRTRS